MLDEVIVLKVWGKLETSSHGSPVSGSPLEQRLESGIGKLKHSLIGFDAELSILFVKDRLPETLIHLTLAFNMVADRPLSGFGYLDGSAMYKKKCPKLNRQALIRLGG